jgi:hypothetical protein
LDVPGLINLEGHLIGPPAGDPRIDITDIYAFVKPGDSSRSVLILNVNPLHLSAAFHPDAIYEILVDNNGDAVPDIAYKTKFSQVASDGSQTATMVRATGGDAEARDFSGSVIIANAPVSFGATPNITTSGSYKYFAGLRSDPFFFDLLGFFASPINFTGSDFFADKNVFGTVLELPNSDFGTNPHIGVWARNLLPNANAVSSFDGGMNQIDRMGRPEINTVFMQGRDKVRFNNAEPSSDVALFTDRVVAVLESFGYNATDAGSLASVLLPDILTFDYTNTGGFLNGRKRADDVIDIELNLVTKGAITGDGAGPHTDYLSTFPYLGTPH